MYTSYFGLKENPFSIAPDPQYLYLGRRDREALAHFQYGISVSGGFVQLTGEVGTGKTMLIRALLEELPDNVDVALVLNPVMTVLEFVAAVCDELRVDYPKDTTSLKVLVDALNQFLLANHARGRRTVLIMDEAQNLDRKVLEQVRLLTNLETSKHKLLQIILVGQQELTAKLARHDMRQLAQRITARYCLGNLGRSETREYIAHRCQVAGADRIPFTRTAMNAVYRLSRGNPRLINIICDRALLAAYSRTEPVVAATTVRRAAAEAGRGAGAGRPRWQWSLALGAGVLVIGLGLLASWPRFSAFHAGRPAPATAKAEKAAAPAAQAELAGPVKSVAAGERHADLAKLLADPKVPTDTQTAFRGLFARWGLGEVTLVEGRTGCEIAEDMGLACILSTGTWNHLRNYNRPALIELRDGEGQRHHVLLSALDAQAGTVELDFGGERRRFNMNEVDQYWYGKYLLFWRPPASRADALHRGTKGESVVWLRDVLARYQGAEAPSTRSDLFDSGLEDQVKAFQRDHRLIADGIVGQFTLMQLKNYDSRQTPPTLWQLAQSRKG